MSAGAPVIETHGLRKEFGSKVAVKDLTLVVERGEVFGFLGPNGAGKTTSQDVLVSWGVKAHRHRPNPRFVPHWIPTERFRFLVGSMNFISACWLYGSAQLPGASWCWVWSSSDHADKKLRAYSGMPNASAWRGPEPAIGHSG
jgi:hypothetical protein